VTLLSPPALKSFASRAFYSRDLRKSAFGFGLQIAGKLLAMAAVLIMTRALTQDDYGTFAYARSWVLVLGPLATFGLGYTAYRFLPQYMVAGNLAEANGFLVTALIVSTAVSLAVAGGQALLYAGGLDLFPPGYGAAMTAMIWAVPATALMQVLRFTAQAAGRIGAAFAPYFVVVPGLQCLALLGLILAGELTLTTAIAAFLVANLVALALAGGFTMGAWSKLMGFRRPSFRVGEWVGVSLPITISSIATLINQQADLIMVGSMLEAKDAALYSIGMSLSWLVSMIGLSVSAVFVPRISASMAGGERGHIIGLLRRAALIFFFPAVGMVAVFVVAGPLFLTIFGPAYAGAYGVLCLLSLSELTVAASEPSGHMMNISGHHKANTLIVVVGAVANVALNLVLTPRYGISGAAMATLLSTIGWTTARVIVTYRHLGLVSGIYAWLVLPRRH
jgi:O-antigen/teichoic acid export membrane protein